VTYEYRIGKYEISEQMIDKANAEGAMGITKDTRGPDKPATSLSWFEAARFVNWLNTSTGHTPAYKFDGSGNFQLWQPGDPGYDPANLFRNTLAWYFLPSANEWYKAAFYNPAISNYWDYPTASNDVPISVAFGTTPGTAVWNRTNAEGPADVMLAGGPSPYGTIGQAGNVWEWEETEGDFGNDSTNVLTHRGVRGGDWNPTVTALALSTSYRGTFPADGQPFNGGVRVASIVPEPATAVVTLLGMAPAILRRSKRRNVVRRDSSKNTG
jgi:formylglycine-generating enzyme required for sulfatase activity